ncbi:MAG: L-lactate dehydrogenase [Candidatus Lokiarchaeota archaeon]|nr:L-lactate dehydrogenase [Candidatus Lokiarchaeota archaeon]
MRKTTSKISIIGGGNVGIRYAYAMLIKNLTREIVIVDIDKERVEGEVMDLSHGIPFYSPVKLSAGDYPNIYGSDLIVITAGISQKPGQNRLDLVKTNAELYKKIIPEIMEYAPKAILVVVTNPVDILSYIAFRIAHQLTKKPAHEVIGSGTVLDSARFRYILGTYCSVDPANVHGYILGEHGDSEFAAWSSVSIGGVLLKDYCPVCERHQDHHDCEDHKLEYDEIVNQVRNAAYEIINRKGESSYGIGIALTRITRAILKDENSILPVSSLISDYLGLEDVYLSIPAIINHEGVRSMIRLELNSSEQIALKKSAEKIKDVLKNIALE